MRWELKFWIVGQIMMMLLAPLVGNIAAHALCPNLMAFNYVTMAAVLWPMLPIIYTIIFRPHVI